MNMFIKHYGEKHQMEQLRKEAIELAHAIDEFADGKGSLENVQEEMGDCMNLLGQFEEHWGDGKLYCVVAQKRERQIERMKKGE